MTDDIRAFARFHGLSLQELQDAADEGADALRAYLDMEGVDDNDIAELVRELFGDDDEA